MLDGVQWPSTGGSEITTRYMRARAHITRVLCFLLSQVSHKLYNPLCNNYLHWFQKQHPSMSHFHSTTPPQKLPKTPSSKQLFDLQSKTTRHFPQNDTSLSIKRYVVFGMMKYFRFHPLWHLWQQKIKTPRTGARILARVRTPSPIPNHPLIQPPKRTPLPFRSPPPQKISTTRHSAYSSIYRLIWWYLPPCHLYLLEFGHFVHSASLIHWL